MRKEEIIRLQIGRDVSMRVIKPSVQLLKNDTPMKHIERIGRICYKSEDRITDESAPKFIDMIRGRGHWAMLEHYFFIFKVPEYVYNLLINEKPRFFDLTNDINGPMISFNPRAIMDLLNLTQNEWAHVLLNSLIDNLVLNYNCYELFGRDRGTVLAYETSLEEIELEELLYMGNYSQEEMKVHGWASTIWKCDRGVSHELVRHEGMMSFAQESTRYCNYSKDKFGNEITVIYPSFFDMDSTLYETWKHSCEISEHNYFKLIECGAQPQQARSVLPNSLKTEVAITGKFREWTHFFGLRTDKAAHPQMRELAIPLCTEFNLRFDKVIF